MRHIFAICIILFYTPVWAQIELPQYKVTQDSATHITVVHVSGTELFKVGTDPDTSLPVMVSPDIRIKNGTVDHKNLTGELYVREVYVDSVLLGYLEYDGHGMKREVYYNADGNIYLEKRFVHGRQTYINQQVQYTHPSTRKKE